MNDPLSAAIAALSAKIREKESELERIQGELSSLRERAEKLDEARSILVEETAAGQNYAMKLVAEQRNHLSLQEEIMICLQSPFANPKGNSAADVMALLKARKYPMADSKSFYSAVYTTLKRLCEKNEIMSLTGERGRLFAAKDATSNLFAHDMNPYDGSDLV